MTEQEINPFDVSSYSNDLSTSNEKAQAVELPQEEATQTVSESTESTPTESTPVETVQEVKSEPTATETKIETTETPTQELEAVEYEWNNDVAKNIYDGLVSGNVSEIADILYEQKVLSELDTMSESDIVKLRLAYDYPDLTPQEIEEEFASKYSADKDFDQSLMSEEEITAKNKQIEKQEKAIARELKKDVRDAKDYLQTLKQDISFPDILSHLQQKQAPVNTDDIVNQYLESQEQENAKVYQEAREVFEKSIEDGLKGFEGFNVSYKDEEVQFDGKYALSPEEKAQLQSDLKTFDLESFYGPRYYKDGKYDSKQLAEDVYFLQNRDKIVNSMVTQAVSKAKSDLLKGMKNIDYSNAPRQAAVADTSDYDKMVGKMFSL
jgi:hypothetical protein